jgi:hypothetical protein
MTSMTNTTSLVGSPLTQRLNAASLWLILVVTSLGAVITLIFGIIGIVTDLTTRSATLNMVVGKPLPAAALGTGRRLASGTYDIAAVHVNHLSSEALTLNATAEIAETVVQVSLWALVAYLSWRLLHGRALRRSLSIIVGIAGLILILGGAVYAAANSITPGLAAQQLNAANHNHFWPLAGRFDGSLLGVGFVVLVIAYVFEYGARLQKETEGLV